MTEKTVTFAKKHVYGGHTFVEGDKLTLPAKRAKTLPKDVLKAPAKKKGDD